MESKEPKIIHPKYGEIKCEQVYASGKHKGEQCKNGAYFRVRVDSADNVDSVGAYQYLCGMHSRSFKNRKELVKMTASEKKEKKDDIYNRMKLEARAVAKINVLNLKPGEIILVRMSGRFPHVPPRCGWWNVYPNFKSAWQGIGLVFPSLSPMSLGPVKHGQPGLPDALNIENFHQQSKCYLQFESHEEFKKNQIAGFLSDKPQRHKFKFNVTEGKNNQYKNKNIPDYFVWIDKDGKEHRLSGKKGYIQSRQFYCNFYDRLVENHEDFIKLKKLLMQSYNLQICGPDAYPISTISTIEEAYLSAKVPFGHERVLYTMLTQQSALWPWRKYKTFEF